MVAIRTPLCSRVLLAALTGEQTMILEHRREYSIRSGGGMAIAFRWGGTLSWFKAKCLITAGFWSAWPVLTRL